MKYPLLKAWLIALAVSSVYTHIGNADEVVAPPHPILVSKWHGAYESYDNCMVYADVILNGDHGQYIAYADYGKHEKVGSAQLCHITATPRPDGTILLSGAWIWSGEPHVCGPFAWVCKGNSFEGVWSVSPTFKEFPVNYNRKYAWYGQRYSQAQAGPDGAPGNPAPPVQLPQQPPQQPPLDAFKQGQPQPGSPPATGGQPAPGGAPVSAPPGAPASSPTPQGHLVQQQGTPPSDLPANAPPADGGAPAAGNPGQASPAPDNSLVNSAPSRQEVDQFVQGLPSN